jgi:hypothetical protein
VGDLPAAGWTPVPGRTRISRQLLLVQVIPPNQTVPLYLPYTTQT